MPGSVQKVDEAYFLSLFFVFVLSFRAASAA